MLRNIVLVFLLLLVSKPLFATAQIGDLLVMGLDTFVIHTNPLEKYFELVGNRDLPGFVGTNSTACWRGYQAVWRVINDSLFLEKIQSCHKMSGSKNADLQAMFGQAYKNGHVNAYWFSGIVVSPRGRVLRAVHMGYASLYERNVLIEVDAGSVRKVIEMDAQQYDAFKATQFELFRGTAEYQKIVAELKQKNNYSQEYIDSFLKLYVIEYSSRILEE